jgi:hypothetical protein
VDRPLVVRVDRERAIFYDAALRSPRPLSSSTDPRSAIVQEGKPVKGNSPGRADGAAASDLATPFTCRASSRSSSGLVGGVDPPAISPGGAGLTGVVTVVEAAGVSVGVVCVWVGVVVVGLVDVVEFVVVLFVVVVVFVVLVVVSLAASQ